MLGRDSLGLWSFQLFHAVSPSINDPILVMPYDAVIRVGERGKSGNLSGVLSKESISDTAHCLSPIDFKLHSMKTALFVKKKQPS